MSIVQKKSSQSGFTLIELLVVCAVNGFIVVAATGIMVSFTKIKYMADVQVQLKSEATFAANQIDLLIRNSTGIPDLCISQYEANNQTQYCSGDYQQSFSSTEQISCNLDNNSSLEACWGTSTSHCIYYPPFAVNQQIPSHDRFDTYTNDKYYSLTERASDINGTYAKPLYQKSYRFELAGRNDATFQEYKNYLIVQSKKETPSLVISTEQPESTFFKFDSGNRVKAQDAQTTYYNQIISIQKESSAGYNRDRLTVNEFKIGETLNGIDTSRPSQLFEYAKGYHDSNYNNLYGDNSKISNLFLTSQSVMVNDLKFDCTLRNYGLPTQTAAIKYNLTVSMQKESLSDIYASISNDYAFETYSITRLVTVRNSDQPFRYTQHTN